LAITTVLLLLCRFREVTNIECLTLKTAEQDYLMTVFDDTQA